MNDKTEQRNVDFEELLQYLKAHRGFDFTGYKRSSLMRRVLKRMSAVPHIDGYASYQDYLEVHPEEFTPLFNTILINVTGFFRDEASWEYIASDIVPRILANKKNGDAIRVCCVGCASGEEAYTVAMLLCEALGEKSFRERAKVYATDVDGDALTQARHAVYVPRAVEAVPESLREKYFDASPANQFVVNPDIRRAVIFGRHDLVQDAPISRLDLLVCRNTLMYFNTETQSRILARFHFALNDDGFLFLGKSEMLMTHTNLFTTVDLRNRVFGKASKVNLRDRLMVLAQAGDADAGNYLGRQIRMREVAFDVVPAAQIVIDLNGRLVMASATARQAFGLTHGDIGQALQDLEISYRPVELRSIIQQAYADKAPVRVDDIKRSTSDGSTQYFDVVVTPLRDNGTRVLGVTVSFVDVTRGHQLQETLQHSNEELETANEELQSTNEELETTNEELQSTNEELETMNEELQATNEELETTNDELQMRTEEFTRVNLFLRSVLGSLRSGVAVLNNRLEVISWNATAEEMWGLGVEEVTGQSIFNLEMGLPLNELRSMIRGCLAGEKASRDAIVEAVNRRGRAIKCRVTCTQFDQSQDERGVVLVMEEMA